MWNGFCSSRIVSSWKGIEDINILAYSANHQTSHINLWLYFTFSSKHDFTLWTLLISKDYLFVASFISSVILSTPTWIGCAGISNTKLLFHTSHMPELLEISPTLPEFSLRKLSDFKGTFFSTLAFIQNMSKKSYLLYLTFVLKIQVRIYFYLIADTLEQTIISHLILTLNNQLQILWTVKYQ